HRRRRDAFAGQLGGDPLADLRLLAGIDQHVELALPEEIDEPGRDRQIPQLDPPFRLFPRKIADGGDAVAADPDVRPEPRRPGPVDDAPAGEDQIEDRRAEQRDHACGATATTPSSPSAPSTTARSGSAPSKTTAEATGPAPPRR